jgi:hypothetical protein
MPAKLWPEDCQGKRPLGDQDVDMRILKWRDFTLLNRLTLGYNGVFWEYEEKHFIL